MRYIDLMERLIRGRLDILESSHWPTIHRFLMKADLNELRGVKHKDVFYWADAYEATHDAMCDDLGIAREETLAVYLTTGQGGFNKFFFPYEVDDGVYYSQMRREPFFPKWEIHRPKEDVNEEFAFGMKVSWHPDPVEIFKNPSPSEYRKLVQTGAIDDLPRALVADNGDLYLWFADHAHHVEVALKVDGLTDNAPLFISFKDSQVWWHKWEYYRESEDDLYDGWIRPEYARIMSSHGLKKLFPAGFKLMAEDDDLWEITPQWIEQHVEKDIVSESMEIMPTRVSQGCPVHDVRSASQFQNLMSASRDNQLRGMLFDRELHVWDAFYATHSAYEESLGDFGAARLMLGPNSLEYNMMDWWDDEKEDYMSPDEVRAVLSKNRALKRIFGEALATLPISGNEC